MRLAFLGTPEAAVPSLRALVDAGHDVALVVTRPDRKRGRGGQLSPSPVKACAHELGLSVSHQLGDLDDLDVDRGVVVAYGRLIAPETLQRTPMLNVHFSLLPRWRGAAPVEHAILAGDVETGVSIMTLDAGLDTGPVHLERPVTVDDKSLAALLEELAHVGAVALIEVLGSPELLARARAQVGEVTYATKLSKADFRLTPSVPVERLLRIIRLGRAFATIDGRRVLVERAWAFDGDAGTPGSVTLLDGHVVLGTSDGAIALERVRPESGKSMSGAAWWSGGRREHGLVRWA